MPVPILTPNDVAKLARDRRIALGLTQSQLARKLNKTQAWVSHFERGNFENVMFMTVIEVLETLGLSLQEATTGTQARPVRGKVPQEHEGELALGFDEGDDDGVTGMKP